MAAYGHNTVFMAIFGTFWHFLAIQWVNKRDMLWHEAEFKGSVHKVESQVSNRKSVSNNLLVNTTMIIFNIHTSLVPRLAS